jgi:hypothetical protein
MPCGTCVDKLAHKLVEHHKIDLIRAYELAEKAVERVEGRAIVKVESGNPTDYTMSCIASGSCYCYSSTKTCQSNLACLSTTQSCACSCPSPPIAHSHYVSNTCVSSRSHNCACNLATGFCYAGRTCTCVCSGLCNYDCDSGYVWNPTTQQCEPVAVAKKFQGEGLTFSD